MWIRLRYQIRALHPEVNRHLLGLPDYILDMTLPVTVSTDNAVVVWNIFQKIVCAEDLYSVNIYIELKFWTIILRRI